MKTLIYLLSFCSLFQSCSEATPENSTATPNLSVNNAWLGTWNRREWKNGASLEINQIKKDSIEFFIFSSSGGHLGDMEGFAKVSGNTARFYLKDDSETCILTFKLVGDSTIIVDQKGTCGCGLNVWHSGSFIKEGSKADIEVEENLLTLKILKTKSQDSIFRALVGDNYESFVQTTQLTSKDDDLDTLNASVMASGIRGLFTSMENIIMINDENEIWAAVILDDNKVLYFTNSTQYKDKLPATIEHWRENFKDYPVIFKRRKIS